MKILRLLLWSALASGSALDAAASRYEQLFPGNLTVGDQVLERKGVSKLTVGYVFDVYVAAFYQPAGSGPDRALADEPRHLELYYLRNIDRADFISAADDMLAKQHDAATIRAIQPGIERINPLYSDVKKTDRYSLTYLPGTGTELKYNGESKGVIEGADFARVYFSIWLGEKNPYKKFRDGLVGP